MSQQPLSKSITPSNSRGRFDPIAFFVTLWRVYFHDSVADLLSVAEQQFPV